MTKEKIILIGGGGHCHSCIDVIEEEGRFEIAGIIDQESRVSEKVLGYPVIGIDSDIPKYINEYKNGIVTLGQIKTSKLRIDLYKMLKDAGATLPIIISPHAYVSKHSKIGEGTIIMHGAIINTNCKIGNNCIINSNALCEHDSIIGNHCHISTGATVNGNCCLGDEVFVGSNACLKQGITITQGSVLSYGEKHG